MEQFTELPQSTTQQPESVYKSDYRNLVKIDGWEVDLELNDRAVVLVHFIEQNVILLRREPVPSFEHVTGEREHLVMVGGRINDDETPEEAMFRELFEETGIIVKTNYDNHVKWAELFYDKGSTEKCHLYYVPLSQYQYEERPAPTDGSKHEAESQNVKVSIRHINALRPADMVTAYSLELLKKELGM